MKATVKKKNSFTEYKLRHSSEKQRKRKSVLFGDLSSVVRNRTKTTELKSNKWSALEGQSKRPCRGKKKRSDYKPAAERLIGSHIASRPQRRTNSSCFICSRWTRSLHSIQSVLRWSGGDAAVQMHHGMFAVLLNSPVEAEETICCQKTRTISEYLFSL